MTFRSILCSTSLVELNLSQFYSENISPYTIYIIMHSFSGNRFEDQTTACPSFSYSKHNFSLQEMFLITFYLPSQHTCKRCDHDIHPILLCKRIYICMHRYRLSLAIVENPAPEKRRTINSQSAVHLYSCCRGSPWSYMLRR